MGLLFLLPVGPLQAQDADGTIEYPENGTDAVATFSATDPDMDSITWTVIGTDASQFTINAETGELKFVSSPNYEMPRGIDLSDTNTNTYTVTVTATDDQTPGLPATKNVMVKVTDVEERATIELSTRQPVVGQSLMATLKNDDEVASGVRWTWEKKDGATWVDAIGTTTSTDAKPYSSTYTPVQNEINAELRVGVEYIDSDDDNQTVAAVTFEQAVAPSAGGPNVAPEFEEDDPVMRTVAENAAAGTAVGDPVTAADDHRTALTYTMTQTAPTLDAGEESPFEIDSRTGQIRVREGAELNYDVEAERTYTITVTVADPDGGDAATATVTVMVTDVVEAPKVTGPASVMVTEGEGTTEIGTYMGRDEADGAIGLILEGADAADFELTPSDNDYVLSFNAPPDFEKPTDTGSNNEYQVTVAATDRGFKTTQSVVVRVTNMDEDGKIELTPAERTVGKSVMAELSDEDVVQARTVTWLWSSKDETGVCGENTDFVRGDRIAGATSDTYTPTAAECLRVTARYTDGEGGNKNAMATVTVGARTSNVPMFAEADPIIRSVNENANVGAEVGEADDAARADPVEATDADTGNGDTLTYTIENVTPSVGTARFSIDNTGQLQTEEMLDHEEQASYMLEVKATDSTGNSAMVTVTVNVNDVNDAPGDIADSRRNNDYPENGTAVVATFSATDPDMDDIAWSLSGDDVGDFTIDPESGELEFNTPPNYENKADADTDNTYEITVMASDGDTPPGTATKDVMVKVTDVEERATIELSTRQPVVGQELTATLGNADEVVSDVRWTWSGIAGTPTDTQTNSTYTPVGDDANDRLRVGVKYIDTDGREQTVAAVAFEQLVAPSLAVGAANADPSFAEGTGPVTRTIAENAAAGTAVGDPVTATDDHRTALTYQMTQTTPSLQTGEESPFEIDSRTGQIRVREGAKLNYDVETERTYALRVTVPDPDGGTAGTITVNVNVTDVTEAPKVTGSASAMVEEGMTTVGTYTGRDEAGAAIGLTLEGADASAFELTRNNDGDYDLAFRTAPDFEEPTDTGSNNEYQVTVAATDRGLKTTQSVVVRVTNMNEDGEIKLTPEAPTVGKPVMAELSDEDVVQARTVTWLWSSNDETGCDENTTFERGDRIAGATSDTYTPTAAECLRVTARYDDGEGGNKNAMATVTVGARTSNVPMFAEADPIIRSIDENVAVGTDVGSVATPSNASPVVATDADTDDTLTYTIENVTPSSGAARFSIDNEGQLQTEEMLDHEEQASYMLEVKASDPSGNSAMVTVTVNVNDVNESPEIIVGGLAISSRSGSRIEYAEDRRDTVATYRASGPDADMAAWSLEGDDAGDFRISSGGVLTFSPSPNYESPADSNTDNTYMVMVKANDGTNDAMKAVTVVVTNVDEPGRVTLSATQPTTGTALMATLADPDSPSGVTVVAWQWATQNDDGTTYTDITGANDAAYTPLEADVGKILRATASYTDAQGSGKSAQKVTANAVVAEAAGVPGDSNNDGKVDKREVIAAFQAYVSNPVDKAQIIAIFQQYVADAASSQ